MTWNELVSQKTGVEVDVEGAIIRKIMSSKGLTRDVAEFLLKVSERANVPTTFDGVSFYVCEDGKWKTTSRPDCLSPSVTVEVDPQEWKRSRTWRK